MAYIYRFKDINDCVIYIGYTGQNLSQRMNQHFTKGHLPKKCYSSVAKIEYQQYKTKADAQIMEVRYINKYKPFYNKLNKQNDSITINIGEEKEWKTYRVFDVKPSKSNRNFNIFTFISAIIYILLILFYLFLK